jgi:hypothetical protein
MPLPDAREIIGVILFLEDVRKEWDVVVLLMPVTTGDVFRWGGDGGDYCTALR